jgi:hypothetical protein
MSLRIKETPILKGKDVEIFLEQIIANKEKSISQTELSRIQKNYRIISDLSNITTAQ